MRKFLETFPTIQIDNLYKVYPDYGVMLSEIMEVAQKVEQGVSVEAQEQYEQLMDTFDEFLLRPESIDMYNEVFPRRPLNKELLPSVLEKVSLEERERIEIELEQEISDLMQGVETKFIKTDVPDKLPSQEVVGEAYVPKTKEDFDEEDRYIGISFKYAECNQTKFEKALIMLGQGCKFYYATFGGKNLVMFKLKGLGRIIIETKEIRTKFDFIFGPLDKDLNVYFLNDNQYSLETIFNLFESSFRTTDEKNDVLSEEFLYNTRYITASYSEGLLWKEAEQVQQDKGISLRGSYLETYFSLFNPLQSICVMVICKEIHSNVNVDRDAKSKIEKIIEDLKFKIEGISFVSHQPNILTELQERNLIDVNYALTPFGVGAMDYNFNARLIMPQFRPFAYYMNDLEKELKNSKNKYYSIFNGTTLYHTKKDVDKIDYAIYLSTPKKKLWEVNEAEQIDAFPISWQQTQNFSEYVQFLPYGADGKLEIRKMDSKRQGKGLQTFRDLSRNRLYIASTVNPTFNWCIDAQNYSYIKKMFSKDNIRILGNNNAVISTTEIAFFMIVNDDNNLLAVLPALQYNEKIEKVEVNEAGIPTQTKMEFKKQYYTSSGSQQPKPVWDVEEIMNNLETKYPKFVLEGRMTDDIEDVVYVEEEKEKVKEKSKNDIIIDLDNPESPIIEVEDEKSIMIRDLNEELLLLQELEQDDEIIEEINQIKEKLEALK